MKATMAIVLGLNLIASAGFSQPSTNQASSETPFFCSAMSYTSNNISQAKKGYLWSLKSENDGVVDAVLAHVTHMRIILPQEDMRDIESAITRLANNGRTPVIRYKAYLASLVFFNPSSFSQVVADNHAGSDEFFSAIASRLQQTLLGYGAQ